MGKRHPFQRKELEKRFNMLRRSSCGRNALYEVHSKSSCVLFIFDVINNNENFLKGIDVSFTSIFKKKTRSWPSIMFSLDFEFVVIYYIENK